MRVTIGEWTNKNTGRAYSKYLGCEKVKLALMLHENIHAKTFARMDSACPDQFRSFVIDQQHFKYEANTSAFLKDLKFSIKLSSVKANCSTLECQGKKSNNNNRQTNKKNKMNLFLLQKYTTFNFSLTTASIAWKFTLFDLLCKSIDVLKMKFLKGEIPVLHIKSVKGIVALNF